MNEREPRPDDAPLDRDLRLARFHDGELSPAEAADEERGLGEATDGAATLAWYHRLGDALRFGRPTGAPVGLEAAIMRRIRMISTDDHPLISLLPAMRRLAVAAAFLTAVTGAGFWLQRGKAGAPDDATRRLVSVERSGPLGRVTMEIRAPASGRLLR